MKEIKYIKYGSYAGYKVFEDQYHYKIWKIGCGVIMLPKEIAKKVISEINGAIK